MEILIFPHQSLITPSESISKVDRKVQSLSENMLETMYKNNGIGLAAAQVNVLKKIITIDISEEIWDMYATDQDKQNEHNLSMYTKKPLIIINPAIKNLSADTRVINEGCLSFPGQQIDIRRPSIIQIEYIDEHGKTQEMSAGGILSRCIQHEIDHINGKVFIDYLSRLKRSMVVNKMHKYQKSQ